MDPTSGGNLRLDQTGIHCLCPQRWPRYRLRVRHTSGGSIYLLCCFCILLLRCDISVFEIALIRLSETSDYLLGQVNNPLAVIRRTSGNLQQYFIFHYHFIIMQS